MRKLLLLLLILISTNNILAQLKIKKAFPDISFGRPVDLQRAPDNSDRIFVADQQGYIYVFKNDSSVISTDEFLNISDSISRIGSEEGLLGLAFHPNYNINKYFYVYYSAKGVGKSVVARYTTSQIDSNKADQTTKQIIMEIEQPFRNHNGGQLAFGEDGYLYISLGDGGGSGGGNAQNLQTLLGSILRIDVDSSDNGNNYAIPDDNPFAGNQNDWKEEIYAYGLRNPWRFSFDFETNRLWCGDVGQAAYEEIDIIESGKNYGWKIMEGFHCYNFSNCNDSGLTLPVWEYLHNGNNRSISGGYVYRGSKLSELFGKYIYGDFVSGEIWALQYDSINGSQNKFLLSSGKNISSFGVDQNDELYICAFDGFIYKFQSTPSSIGQNESPLPYSFKLYQNTPNPFNPTTKISLEIEKPGFVELSIFNINGQKIKTIFNGFKQAGIYKFSWNGKYTKGRDVSSGIYFYTMRVNNSFSLTKRMLLIR